VRAGRAELLRIGKRRLTRIRGELGRVDAEYAQREDRLAVEIMAVQVDREAQVDIGVAGKVSPSCQSVTTAGYGPNSPIAASPPRSLLVAALVCLAVLACLRGGQVDGAVDVLAAEMRRGRPEPGLGQELPQPLGQVPVRALRGVPVGLN
jgi:hypothetical protein